MVGTRDWEQAETGSCYLMGGEFQFYKMVTFTEMSGGDGCIHTHKPEMNLLPS